MTTWFKWLAILLISIYSSCLFSATENKKTPIKNILFVVAMENEADPIIHIFHLKPYNHSFDHLPMKAYTGIYKNIKISLISNGLDPVHHVPNIGTQPATLSTYLGIHYFNPDLVISIGTAGGIPGKGVNLKDIIYSTTINFYGRRIPIKDFKEYGEGNYKAYLLSSIPTGLKPGVICSGDAFDENETDTKMFQYKQCTAIEMEAAAVAWVSMISGKPVLAIKGVTNFVVGPEKHEDFRKNSPEVIDSLAKTAKNIADQFAKS